MNGSMPKKICHQSILSMPSDKWMKAAGAEQPGWRHPGKSFLFLRFSNENTTTTPSPSKKTNPPLILAIID